VQALSAADTEELIEAAGAEIAVKCWGRGQPILCLHAAGHGSADFELMAERLQDEFEIIALDLPGHGRSPRDGVGPGAERWADILEGAVEALYLERPILMGNGLGGAAALMAAARRPTTYAGLVLCNAPGLARMGPMEKLACKGAARVFEAGERGAPWFAPAFETVYRQVLTGAPARDQRRRIVAAAGETAPLLAQAWRDMGRTCADLTPLAERVKVPTWIAWAKGDRFMSWRANRDATRLFRKACATGFRGGRAPFLEDPDAFAETFRRLAAENLGA
jgi:4,5:9,10-diseco-3-hydroxy-5,9,17-trioxoandrosta-1(10),2-diene-4-oate hydrolase